MKYTAGFGCVGDLSMPEPCTETMCSTVVSHPLNSADLHLLHYADTILLKPLPAYILSKEVWDQILCKDAELHKNACGLLLSYIWLIRSPLDFKLAIEKDSQLLPAQLSWATWKRIVDESLQYIDPDTLHQCNKRYQFGELRLGRINTIYRMNPRFFLTHFVRGYLYGYKQIRRILPTKCSMDSRSISVVLACTFGDASRSGSRPSCGQQELQTSQLWLRRLLHRSRCCRARVRWPCLCQHLLFQHGRRHQTLQW